MVYIVGGGSKIDFYKEKVKNIFNIKIKFTGPIIREELNKIYSKSHIIILPSFSEVFQKLLEKLALMDVYRLFQMLVVLANLLTKEMEFY